jgi:amino acid transporter
MKNEKGKPIKIGLKKTLGVASLFAVAVGSVSSQSSFVTLLNGAGLGGIDFFLALGVAFLLAICYSFSFLELSLMMPRAGGLGNYVSVAGGNFLSIGVMLGGYLFAVPFNLPVEVFLMEHVAKLIQPGMPEHWGIALVVLLTALNLLGIDVFSTTQNLLVYVLLVALVSISLVGLRAPVQVGSVAASLSRDMVFQGGGFLSLLVLAFWSFCGLEFVCPLVEESRDPRRSIPRAMLGAAVVLLVIFSGIAWAGMRQVPVSDLAKSDIPHWLLVDRLFGRTGGVVMMFFTLLTASSVLNTVLASTPRMLYGMAQMGQLPSWFSRLHSRWGTPWFSIVFVAALILLPLLLLTGKKEILMVMLLSCTMFWTVAYGVAHATVIILRRNYPRVERPFRTPLYPLPQVMGFAGVAIILLKNTPSPELAKAVYLNAALLFLIIVAYGVPWVHFRMKKGLFKRVPMTELMDGMGT